MAEISERVRAIFFDLDETLIDDDRCMREAIARTCTTLGKLHPQLEPDRLEATYTEAANKWWTSSGSVPRASGSSSTSGRDIRVEVWGKALEAYGLSNPDIAVEAADIYAQERSDGYSLFPEVSDVLGTLRQKYVLGIISNGPADTQREKLHVTGLIPYLHTIVISGELGVGKPDSGIFLKALESVRVNPEEAIHVGDSLTADIAGARNVGMYAVWINRSRVARPLDAPGPDIEIYSLWDIIPLLTPPDSVIIT